MSAPEPMDELAGAIAGAIVDNPAASEALTTLVETQDANAHAAIREVVTGAIGAHSPEEAAAAQDAMAKVRAERFPTECPDCGEPVLARETPPIPGGIGQVVLLDPDAAFHNEAESLRAFAVLDDERTAVEIPWPTTLHVLHSCEPTPEELDDAEAGHE